MFCGPSKHKTVTLELGSTEVPTIQVIEGEGGEEATGTA